VDTWARERFERARVGRLATTTPRGRPHLVPVVFALVGNNVWTAVDAKPKSTSSLRRLVNIESNPRVSMLVDHYDDDWSALWWVRVDGDATVLPVDAEGGRLALSALATKYPQYAALAPPGPLICIVVDSWTSWSARGRPPFSWPEPPEPHRER
jgi:PPOX class probable F420-dependent enzyme